MSTDLTTREGTHLTTLPEPTITYADPTGGRLVAWAEAASAANTLARALCQTAFVPRVKKGQDMVPLSVGDATAAILMGDELGLSPLAALRSIYVVHGTPALYARSMVALAQSHGHRIWTETSTDARVVVCGQRRGSDQVERAEWTIQRATKAKYTNNPKYATNPQEMLYAKAAAEVARKVAADVLAGVPYSVEDLELEQPATRTVTREAAAPEGKRTVRRAQAPEPAEPPLEPEPPVEPAQDGAEPTAEPITAKQLTALHAALSAALIGNRDDGLRFISETVGREVATSKDLTKDEASKVIDALHELSAPPAEEPTLDESGWPA